MLSRRIQKPPREGAVSDQRRRVGGRLLRFLFLRPASSVSSSTGAQSVFLAWQRPFKDSIKAPRGGGRLRELSWARSAVFTPRLQLGALTRDGLHQTRRLRNQLPLFWRAL